MDNHSLVEGLRTVAVVTGASSGIGEAFCRQLAERCSDIVAVARRSERLNLLREQLLEQGVIVHCVEADLSTQQGIQKTMACIDALAPITYLVNSAGFGCYGNFAELTLSTQHF